MGEFLPCLTAALPSPEHRRSRFQSHRKNPPSPCLHPSPPLTTTTDLRFLTRKNHLQDSPFPISLSLPFFRSSSILKQHGEYGTCPPQSTPDSFKLSPHASDVCTDHPFIPYRVARVKRCPHRVSILFFQFHSLVRTRWSQTLLEPTLTCADEPLHLPDTVHSYRRRLPVYLARVELIVCADHLSDFPLNQ